MNAVADPDPSQHIMHLTRTPSHGQLEASFAHSRAAAGDRPAGVGSFWQVGKTRGVFKHNSVVGQFGNETVSSIPATKKGYHFIREQGMTYVPHQQHTTFVRKELERTGHL